jgi:hypothetical protein
MDVPVLTHHLQNSPPMKTLSSQPDSEDSRLKSLKATEVMNAAECDNFDKTRIPNRDFEDLTHCEHNEWGSDSKINYARKPSAVTYSGVEQHLLQSVIPAQILQSNQTTETTGNFCQASAAARVRNDTEAFEVAGNFRRNQYDCQEQMLSEASCFLADGCGKAKYSN